MISVGVSNDTLIMFIQHIDYNNHEMVNILPNHMISKLNPMLKTTNESYQCDFDLSWGCFGYPNLSGQ